MKVLKSKDLQKLNLSLGANSLAYEVNGYRQEARIFLLEQNQSLVLVDFDGTMTKSDVLGLMTGVMYDWTHKEVVRVVQQLESRGFLVVYLTMRSYEMVGIFGVDCGGFSGGNRRELWGKS
jgi:phosphatidate phosphatase PAH1